MTQDVVKAAIDEAFAEQIKKIFGVLIQRLIFEENDAGIEEFSAGVKLARHARELALKAIGDTA